MQHPTPSNRVLRFIQAASAAVAADPRIPVAEREPVAREVERQLCEQWRDIVGEERVRFRAPQRGPRVRAWTRQQVEAMVLAGETFAAIAKRVDLHPATVGRIAKRLRARNVPPATP